MATSSAGLISPTSGDCRVLKTTVTIAGDFLHAGGVGLRYLLALTRLHLVKRMERLGRIEIEESIVAPGKDGRHVIAVALVFRVVHHADGAVPPRLEQLRRRFSGC